MFIAICTVSRILHEKGEPKQLWLNEHQKKDGSVKALATLHYERNFFLKGLPYAFVDMSDPGKIYYTLDRKEGFEGVLLETSINFDECQLEPLRTQLAAVEGALRHPPLKGKGCSDLESYQLQILFRDDAKNRVGKTETSNFLRRSYSSDMVLSVSLVREYDREWIDVSRSTLISQEHAVKAMFKGTKRVPKTPTTVEETRDVLLSMLEPRHNRTANRLRYRAQRKSVVDVIKGVNQGSPNDDDDQQPV